MRGFNYVITDIEINWTNYKEHIIQKENESFRIALYMVQISSRYKDAYIVNIGLLRTSNGNIKYLKISDKQACVLFNEMRNFKKNSLKIVYLLNFCCLLVCKIFVCVEFIVPLEFFTHMKTSPLPVKGCKV